MGQDGTNGMNSLRTWSPSGADPVFTHLSPSPKRPGTQKIHTWDQGDEVSVDRGRVTVKAFTGHTAAALPPRFFRWGHQGSGRSSPTTEVTRPDLN